MGWIEQARAAVYEATKDLPPGTKLSERRKVLRAAGPLFHGGTYWGRKKWGQAVREYLARHGGAPVPAHAGTGADLGRLKDRIASGDVTFPFRDT